MAPDEPPPTAREAARQIVPAAAILQELENGKVHTEMSRALDAVVRGVHDFGGTGTVTVKITIKPAAKDAPQGPLTLVGDVSSKVPAAPKRPTIRYVNRDGRLSGDDPTQPVIEGLQVAKPVQARVVGGEAE